MYRIGQLAAHTLPLDVLEERMKEASRNATDLSILKSLLFRKSPLEYHDQIEPSQMLEGMRKVYEERSERAKQS